MVLYAIMYLFFPCIHTLQTVQQQQSSNVIVVNSQPGTVKPTTIHVTRNDQTSFMCGIAVSMIAFFCLCWWALVCTIPGTVVGHMVSGNNNNTFI